MRLTTSGVGDRGRLAVDDDGMDELSWATLALHSSMDMQVSSSPRWVRSSTVKPTELDGPPIISVVEVIIG